MKINKLNLYAYITDKTNSNKQKQSTTPSSENIQTSIYNQKGVQIPFCGIAKGIDEAENLCIKLLRGERIQKLTRSRGASPRKFDEYDIKEILTILKKTENPEDKPHIIEEVLQLENETNGIKPDKDIIKNVIKLISGKPEAERYGILEYTMNDLKNGVKPIEELSKLPEEKQNKLVKILKNISDINEHELFVSEKAKDETLDSLYDTFRIALYAEDDLSKLDISQANAYKLDKINILNQDRKYFNDLPNYSTQEAKEKIISVSNSILNYFLDNIN